MASSSAPQRAMTRRLTFFAFLVLIGCGSSTSSGDSADGGGRDGSPVVDGHSGEGASTDGKASESGSPDGANVDYCAKCVAGRCDSTAMTCLATPSCVSEVSCILECGTTACVQACEAADPDESTAAEDLASCEGGACMIPCLEALDAGQMCAPLGESCDPLVPAFSCCAGQGTCATPSASSPESLCCNGVGGSCDMAAINPDAYCCRSAAGVPGQCDAGTCQALACWPTNGGCEMNLPCCDSQLTCTNVGSSGGSICCAPDGTVLPVSESSLCCSHGTAPAEDGGVMCVSP
jgi:hypothetical protein